MERLIKSSKACSVYPLKLSQPLGAIYATLGIKGSIPLVHGSQGCAAFAKTFLTRHFNENIPMQTTALSEITTVMGNDEDLHTAIKNVIDKNKPEFIGIISTGVSETRGDDVNGYIKRFFENYKEYSYTNTKIAFFSTPDYIGSFHDGYKQVINSVVKSFVQNTTHKTKAQVNVLLSYCLTAKDIDTLETLIKQFGFEPIIFPDLRSLDGHVRGFSSITKYGTDVRDIQKMSSSMITIAIGESVKEAGEYLEKNFMIPMFYYDSLIGVENFDNLISLLINISGKDAPTEIKRWRNRLIDVMLDSHFYLTDKKIAVVGEPDFVSGIVRFLSTEIGAKFPIVVVPTYSVNLENILVDKVVIGDIEDLLTTISSNIDLLIGNTNLRHISEITGIPHYRVGIPIFDRLGHFLRGYIGYEGTTNFVLEIANLIMEEDEKKSYKVPDYIKGGKR